MDPATIIGVISGVFLIASAIFLGGSWETFFHVPSLLITVGGTIAATFINYPVKDIFGVLRVVKNTFTFKLSNPLTEINRMVEYAKLARREGLLALENHVEKLKDPFFKKGVRMVIDGFSPEMVREILTIETECLQERHLKGKKIFETMGYFGPAMGMMGTLIGLVQMLQSLEDPSQIGTGMATALLTTFYGAFFANMLCLPLAGKLETRNKEEMLLRSVLIEGILCIQAGDKSHYIKEKLKSFVPPKERRIIEQEEKVGAK